MTHRLNAPLNAPVSALALLLLAGTALPAHAAPVASRAQCLIKAEAAPDFAYEEARLWERQGGGADARLCQAMALLFRADWTQAGEKLEASLKEMTGETAEVRANLWNRAGFAWLNADRYDRALAAYSRAVELAPADAQMRIDRALAHGAAQDFWAAVADLDAVLNEQPKNVEALLLRAEAQRQLSRDHEAMADADRALVVEPDNLNGLLLRGRLAAEQGDPATARADWTRARDLAGDSEAGRTAADFLAALDRQQKAAAR